MTHTRASDLRRAGDALHEIGELEEPAATSAALSAMYQLVPCEFSVIGWLDLERGTVGSLSWPQDAVPEVLHDDPQVVAAHPLVVAMAERGPGTRRIGDVLSDHEWRNHPTRFAMAEGMNNGRPRSLERELGFGSAAPGVVYTYAANRVGREFSDRDRDVMSIVAPGIERHRRLLVRATSARRFLDMAAQHSTDVHAVVIDAAGRVAEDYGLGGSLYERWADPAQRWTMRELHPAGLPPGYQLLAFERPRPELAPRECAVLDLVSQGETSAAIGRHLGMSARTADKHLEHVYRKLEVTDRVSAVRRAFELGLLPTSFRADGPTT
jgi:DNA-binding CsgD family transcriptional regulator